MKTLILYGSRKGCTRKCANLVRERLGDAEALDAAQAGGVDLSAYDAVVLGSSIWSGKIHPKVRGFVATRLEELLGKRIGLFICSGDEKTDHIRINYPERLVERAEAKAHFGGELHIEDFGPIMRFILAKKAGVTESYNRIKPEAISRFAAALGAKS
jgi:menaquinone-dependent protoporphyrinogen oxidase